MQRHVINRFTCRGVVYDYTGKGYEIDDFLRVYKNSEPRGTTGRFEVALTNAGIKTLFCTKRLYNAVVHPLSPDVEKNSGMRVSDHTLPEDHAVRYIYETETHRRDFISNRQRELDAVPQNTRKEVEYFVGRSKPTFSKYEIDQKLGIIVNKASQRTLKAKLNGQVMLQSDDGRRVAIYVYRAYMYTFASRRCDQTQVDHVNGDSDDHRPCNMRWASPSENEMYKFKKPTARTVGGVVYTGDIATLKRFKDTQWYFGNVDGVYSVVSPSMKMRRVGDFLTTKRLPYPSIHKQLLHRVVAYVEGIITRKEFDDPSGTGVVVEHIDHDKTNFSPGNLKRGTQSSNGLAANDNPATTRRKRVRQIDTGTGELVAVHDSITAAAKALGVAVSTMSMAISGEKVARACMYFEWIVL